MYRVEAKPVNPIETFNKQNNKIVAIASLLCQYVDS